MEQKNITKPPQVVIAVKLLYVVLGINIFIAGIEAQEFVESIMTEMGSTWLVEIMFTIIFGILAVVAFCFLVSMVSKGHRLGRMFVVALFLVELPYTLFLMAEGFSTDLFAGLFYAAQAIISLVALVYLFQKQSTAWFKG